MIETKPAVIGDRGGEVSISTKINGFLENLDYQESDETNKNDSSSQRNSFTSVFLTEFLTEELELVVAVENMFENGAKKKHFLEISDCQNTDAKNTNSNQSEKKQSFSSARVM